MDQESQPVSDQLPVVPSTVQPPPKKNNVLLWGLFVVLLLGLGWGLYITAREQGWLPTGLSPIPTPTVVLQPTPTTDPTANWKTYTNTTIGVNFKYPPSWIPTENQKSVTLDTITPSLEQRDGKTINYSFEVIQEDLSNYNQWSKDSMTKALTKKNINGISYERYIVPDMYFSLNYIYKSIGGQIIRIMLFPYTASEQPTGIDTVIDQILSTFKFTNSEKVDSDASTLPTEKISFQPKSDWKTLSDPIAKFSIQYPSSYKVQEYSNGTGGYLLSCVNHPDTGDICLSGYSINIYNNYTGGSRREWLYQQNSYIKDFLYNPIFKDLNVAGLNALAILDTNSGGSTGSWVIIPKGSQVVLLSFPFGGGEGSPGLDQLKQFLSTFTYLQ